MILTTNRGIAQWGEIFEDTTVAAAILDRLLHHATVLQIDGDSYRMRGHRARLQQLRARRRGRAGDQAMSAASRGSERQPPEHAPPAPSTVPCPRTRASSPHSSPPCSSATSRSSSGSTTPTVACSAPTNGSAQDSRPTRSASSTTAPRRQRSHQPDRRAHPRRRARRQQPDARGPATDPLADPSRASAPTNTPPSSADSSPSTSASSPNSSPRRCAPPAGARTRRDTPTCTNSPGPNFDRRSTWIVATTPLSGQPEPLHAATLSRPSRRSRTYALHR